MTGAIHRVKHQFEEWAVPLIGWPTIAVMYYVAFEAVPASTQAGWEKKFLVEYMQFAGYPSWEIQAVQSTTQAELHSGTAYAPDIPLAVLLSGIVVTSPLFYAMLIGAVGLGLMYYIDESE